MSIVLFLQDEEGQELLNSYYGTDEEVSDYMASEDEDGGQDISIQL
jgi:hypothetical protein